MKFILRWFLLSQEVLCRENKELEYILNDYILEIEFEIGKTELNIKLMESIEKRQKIKTIN
ncbi:hypothetical protein ABFP04_08440 [Acinetobacter towneri]|uniref:hypothetical protein n=1 Tax=Acinetobacter towneri TaxID=202956 RepID=UPI00321203B2